MFPATLMGQEGRKKALRHLKIEERHSDTRIEWLIEGRHQQMRSIRLKYVSCNSDGPRRKEDGIETLEDRRKVIIDQFVTFEIVPI